MISDTSLVLQNLPRTSFYLDETKETAALLLNVQNNIVLNSLSKRLYNISERVSFQFVQYDFQRNAQWVTSVQLLTLKDIMQSLCSKLDFINFYNTYQEIGSNNVEVLEEVHYILETNMQRDLYYMLDLSTDSAYQIVFSEYDDQEKLLIALIISSGCLEILLIIMIMPLVSLTNSNMCKVLQKISSVNNETIDMLNEKYMLFISNIRKSFKEIELYFNSLSFREEIMQKVIENKLQEGADPKAKEVPVKDSRSEKKALIMCNDSKKIQCKIILQLSSLMIFFIILTVAYITVISDSFTQFGYSIEIAAELSYRDAYESMALYSALMSYKNKEIYISSKNESLFDSLYNQSIQNERKLMSEMIYVQKYYPATYNEMHKMNNLQACNITSNYTQFPSICQKQFKARMEGGITMATYMVLYEMSDYMTSINTTDFDLNIDKISNAIDYYMIVIRDVQGYIKDAFIQEADDYFEKLRSICILVFAFGLLIFVSIFLIMVPYFIFTLNTRMYQTKRLLGMLPVTKMMDEIGDMKMLFAKLA